MLSFLAFSLLAGQALAQPVQHHHYHKRDKIVTQLATAYVNADGSPVETGAAATTSVAPVETSSAAAPVETSSSAPEPETTSEASPAVTPTKETSSFEAPSSTSSSSAPAETSSSSSDSGAGSSGAKGITYSPYTPGGCKSSSQVKDDLSKLSGYSVIRLYGTDCNQVSNVYSALGDGQKLFLGAYDTGDIENEVKTMHDGINGDWSVVDTVSIGNELVNGGQANPSEVGNYIKQARSKLQSLGYSGPVVSVDTFIATINNPDLCKYSDYMAVNAHAFFDGGVSAQDSGKWALEQLQRVSSACGNNKKVTIVESGWPSSGDTNGKAVASSSNQKDAIQSLKDSIGNDLYLFTAYNDYWKQPGYLNCEQSWGVYGDGS